VKKRKEKKEIKKKPKKTATQTIVWISTTKGEKRTGEKKGLREPLGKREKYMPRTPRS